VSRTDAIEEFVALFRFEVLTIAAYVAAHDLLLSDGP